MPSPCPLQLQRVAYLLGCRAMLLCGEVSRGAGRSRFAGVRFGGLMAYCRREATVPLRIALALAFAMLGPGSALAQGDCAAETASLEALARSVTARHRRACRPAIRGRRARRLACRLPLPAQDAGVHGGGGSGRSPCRGAAAAQAGQGQQAGPGRHAPHPICRASWLFPPPRVRRWISRSAPARRVCWSRSISPAASSRARWMCACSTPAHSRSRPWWWRRPPAASATWARPSAARSTSRPARRRSWCRTPSTSTSPSASSSPTRGATACTCSRAATACSRSPPAPSWSTAPATARISRPRRASWWPTSATPTGASWR